MAKKDVARAGAVAGPTILLIIVFLLAAAYLVSTLLGLPLSVNLPLPVRLGGGVMVLAGALVAGWVFRYRRPSEMTVSTYFTFMKLFKGAPIAEFSGRTEELFVAGPQKYVRHPLYLGVIMAWFGLAIASAYAFLLVASVFALLWIVAVLIKFEERELRALFGEQYTRYAARTPMLVPFTKRRATSEPRGDAIHS